MNYVAIDGDGEEKISNCELVEVLDIWKGKKQIHMNKDEYTPIKTWYQSITVTKIKSLH